MKEKNIKFQLKKLLIFILLLGFMMLVLRIFFPLKSEVSISVIKNYGKEVLVIFPAILILMGLAEVWVPKEKIKEFLGKEAGLKGILLSLFLGTLPTGPLFIAFPIAGELLHKGASVTNVIIFLGAYSSLKAPELAMEVHFLGLKFAFYRFILTLISVLCIAFITKNIIGKKEMI